MCRACLDNERDRMRAAQRMADRVAQLQDAATRRSAALALATPPWRDREAIAAIYREARRRTAEGIDEYEVDHFYPIQAVECCGLHVAENLRVVLKSVNRSKRNVMPLDNSPALDGTGAELIAFASS